MNPIHYFMVGEKTLFIPLKVLYPECFVLIDKYPQASPLMCMTKDCPANRSCMEVLAKRVNYWFQILEPSAELMIAYFKYRDRPDSIRAGIFKRDLSEPRTATLNPFGFNKLRNEGIVKQWIPSSEYLNIQGIQQLPAILPVSNLLKRV